VAPCFTFRVVDLFMSTKTHPLLQAEAFHHEVSEEVQSARTDYRKEGPWGTMLVVRQWHPFSEVSPGTFPRPSVGLAGVPVNH
jgi:hypothetical protein